MKKKPVKSAKGASPSKAKPAAKKLAAAAKPKSPEKSKAASKEKDKAPVAKEPEKKPATKGSAKFKQGEMVVYPFHGVGVVKSIEKMNITGVDKWYYTLDFRNGELTVKLPVEQQDEKGMRRVVGKADVETIMVILRKKPPSEESDWKVRYNQYLEKLKSGDIYEAAKVARNLSKRGPEGELSMSEKRLLEASVQLLVHEIATASKEPIEKVESEINKCLRAGRA